MFLLNARYSIYFKYMQERMWALSRYPVYLEDMKKNMWTFFRGPGETVDWHLPS